MHRKAFRSDLNFLVNGKVVKARKVDTLALERLWLRTCTLKSLAICMLEIVAYNGIMDDFTMIFIEIQFTDLHHRD